MFFIVLLLCVWITLIFAVPLLFQFLWNTTVPQIFRLRMITYWQAFRLLLMAAILASPTFLHFNFNR